LSDYYGGTGLDLYSTVATITGSRIERNNHHDYQGGGLRVTLDTVLVLEDTLVADNTAESGGGLYMESGHVTCIGGGDGDYGFLSNTSTLGLGGGVEINTLQEGEGFVSEGCDFGFNTSTNNTPHDVWLKHVDLAYDYGSEADFHCDDDGCS